MGTRIKAITIQVDGEEPQTLVDAPSAPDRSPRSNAQNRHLFSLAETAGMTRDERMEFSSRFLDQDITSWKYLTAYDASRLIDALHGYLLGLELMQLRSNNAVPLLPVT